MTWKRHGGIAAVVVALVGAAVACSQVGGADAGSNTYKLPWAAGQQESVMQGNSRFDDGQHCTSGCSTHNDDAMRFALDFALPERTPVLAARAGRVALTNGSWAADHCGGVSAPSNGDAIQNAGENVVSELIGNEANFVEIDHGDGSSALYLHLSAVSPVIERKAKTGERVELGEVLGLSGKTGYTRCVPHLHFQVEASVKADWFTTSLPVSFVDHDVVARTPDGVPIEGESYISDNVATGPIG